MEMENLYVSPEVEVLEVEVERGFRNSTDDPEFGGGDVNLPGLDS